MSNLWEMAFVLEIYQYCHNHPPSLTPQLCWICQKWAWIERVMFFLKQKSLLSRWFEGRLWKCWGSEEAWSIDQGKWGGRCWTWTWTKLVDENKNCQRQNGPRALSTLTHSTLLVQYLKYNWTKALLGIKLKLSHAITSCSSHPVPGFNLQHRLLFARLLWRQSGQGRGLSGVEIIGGRLIDYCPASHPCCILGTRHHWKWSHCCLAAFFFLFLHITKADLHIAVLQCCIHLWVFMFLCCCCCHILVGLQLTNTEAVDNSNWGNT